MIVIALEGGLVPIRCLVAHRGQRVWPNRNRRLRHPRYSGQATEWQVAGTEGDRQLSGREPGKLPSVPVAVGRLFTTQSAVHLADCSTIVQRHFHRGLFACNSLNGASARAHNGIVWNRASTHGHQTCIPSSRCRVDARRPFDDQAIEQNRCVPGVEA